MQAQFDATTKTPLSLITHKSSSNWVLLEKIFIRGFLRNTNSEDLQLVPGTFMILVKKIQWEKLILSNNYLSFFIVIVHPFKIREQWESCDN